MLNRYIATDTTLLGKGVNGEVKEALDCARGVYVAIKSIPRSKCNGFVTSEIIHHRMLDTHPHLAAFQDLFISPDAVHIVMDLENGGHMLDFVNRYSDPLTGLPEHVARYFFQQLVLAVDYCHKKGVANRDIKLENLLLQQEVPGELPVLKLCDWGFSKDTSVVAKTAAGTLHYMSPQPLFNLVTGQPRAYTATAADMWSCGVCLYAMLTRRYPFSWDTAVMAHREAVIMLRRMQASGEPGVVPPWDRPEATGHLSAQVKELLAGLLAPDEAQRLTVQQIADNEWFRTNLDPQAFSRNDAWVQAPLRDGLPSAADIEACMIAALGPRGARHY